MKNLIFIACIAIAAASCGDSKKPEERLITREGFLKDYEAIKQANPDMDSMKIRLLNSFSDLLKGRDTYLTMLVEGDEDKKKFYDEYIVSEADFNNIVDSIFMGFEQDKITYKMLFNELDSMQAYGEEFKSKNLMPLYNQVEVECLRRQALADFVSGATDAQKDSLLNTDTDLLFLVPGKDTITAADLKTPLNYNYQTPDELFGFCPYISNREPIAVEIRRLKAEREQHIRTDFHLFKKYNENYAKLFR